MMTWEEAIELLNEQYETCKRIYDCSADQRKSYPNVPQFMEALDLAITALRPVSREQVEKVWRGEWKGVPKLGVYDMACSKCGYSTGIRFYSSEFCPNCGVPMTDEAVEMVMERMETIR